MSFPFLFFPFCPLHYLFFLNTSPLPISSKLFSYISGMMCDVNCSHILYHHDKNLCLHIYYTSMSFQFFFFSKLHAIFLLFLFLYERTQHWFPFMFVWWIMQTALFICQAMHVLTSHPKIGMQHPSLSEDLYCFDMKGEFVWH